MHGRLEVEVSSPSNATAQKQQKALASGAQHLVGYPASGFRLTTSKKQVRFSQGPLKTTKDGHPAHEGVTAKPIRRLESNWGKGITKKEVQLLEELLNEAGDVYLPSIIKLKRKCGLLPKERTTRKAERQQALKTHLDNPTRFSTYMASARAARKQQAAAAGKRTTPKRQQRHHTAATSPPAAERVSRRQASRQVQETSPGRAARKAAREAQALAAADAGVFKPMGQRKRRQVVRFNPCEPTSPTSPSPKARPAGSAAQQQKCRTRSVKRGGRNQAESNASLKVEADEGGWSTRLRSQAQQQKEHTDGDVEAVPDSDEMSDGGMDVDSEAAQEDSQRHGDEEGTEVEEENSDSEDSESSESAEAADSEEERDTEADTTGSEGSDQQNPESEDAGVSTPTQSCTSSSGHSESDDGEESGDTTEPSSAVQRAMRATTARRRLPARGRRMDPRSKCSRGQDGGIESGDELQAAGDRRLTRRHQQQARAGKGARKRAKQSAQGDGDDDEDVQFAGEGTAGQSAQRAAPGRRGSRRRPTLEAELPAARRPRRGRAATVEGSHSDVDSQEHRFPGRRRTLRTAAAQDDAGSADDAAQAQRPARKRRRGAAAGAAAPQEEPAAAQQAGATALHAVLEGGDASAADAAAQPQFGGADAAAMLQLPPIDVPVRSTIDDSLTSAGSVLPPPPSPTSVCGKAHRPERHLAAAAADICQPMGPPTRRALAAQPTATVGAMGPPTAHNLRRMPAAATRMTPQAGGVLRQLHSGCGSVHKGNDADRLASTGAVAAYDGPTGSVGQPPRFASRLGPGHGTTAGAHYPMQVPSGPGAVTASGAVAVASGGEEAVSYRHSATCSQDKPPWEVLPPRQSGYRRMVQA